MLKRTRQLKFCATLYVSAIDYKCQRHGVEVRSWANCKYRIQEQKLTAHEDWEGACMEYYAATKRNEVWIHVIAEKNLKALCCSSS